MKNLDRKRALWIQVRMGLLCGAMALGFGFILSTAYHVEIEDGAAWREVAEKQRQRRLHVEPKRGTVFDRNGRELAISVEVPSVSVDAAELLRGARSPDQEKALLSQAAQRIGLALGLPPADVERKLATKARFAWLKRRVSSEEAALVRDLMAGPQGLRGLTIEGEGHRYYPGRQLASALMGFVGADGVGRDGVEMTLDDDLKGHPEELKGLRDRQGRLLFAEGSQDGVLFQGHDAYLTLDQAIQFIAERELEAAQKTYETKGGALIVADPNTGEILAMASAPSFNPNDYAEADPEVRRNRAVADRFEPGSVMKVFTLAAALAAGTLKPNESIFCEHGRYQLAGATIHDTHDNEWLTPTQILAKSSNIGALKIGLHLGENGLYSAFRRFGFGEPTGIALPGEATGVLRPRGRPWFDLETANASFGHGISVSAIQLAMAFGAIANGGRLLQPLLVRKVTDARGATLREGTPQVRREVLSPGIAKMMAEMLTAVTEEGGTAVEAAVPGFRVAGKTATAQKVDATTGKYSADHFTSSFVGFVPAERPRLVVAVVLDDPVIGHFGGDLAGPVFRRVAQASLRYLGVTPSASLTKAAAVRAAAEEGAASTEALARAAADKPGDDGRVPIGAAGALPPSSVRVPDLGGLGAREALKSLVASGLSPQIEGVGRLRHQHPPPGTVVPRTSVVRLVFEPPS